jgi:hypothetical protein
MDISLVFSLSTPMETETFYTSLLWSHFVSVDSGFFFSVLYVQSHKYFAKQNYLTYVDKSSDMQCLWSCLAETGTYIVDKSSSGSPEDTWYHIDLSVGPTLHQTWYLKINEIYTSVRTFKFSVICSVQ